MNMVLSHGNPFISSTSQLVLHNIITQEIMTEDIRKDLLEIKTKSSQVYEKYRLERYIDKSTAICDTIHRNKIKTFSSIHQDKGRKVSAKKTLAKESSQAQKCIELARVRNYNIQELIKYDLVPSSYLFTEEGLRTKPAKSSLVQELEKSLQPSDYSIPADWSDYSTAYLVDVMAYFRKIKTKVLMAFGDLCDKTLKMVLIKAKTSRIDFVFDTYI